MIVFTVKTGRKKTAVIALAAVLLAGLFCIKAISGHINNTETEDIPGSSDDERVAFIENYGLKTDPENVSQKEIIIPSVFNDEYNEYNELQKACGFDLSLYKEKTAVQYSYGISERDGVFARVTVSDGVIIGADICDIKDGGKVLAINDKSLFETEPEKSANGSVTVETILPAIDDGAWPID